VGWAIYLPTYFGVFGTFRSSRLMVQHLSDAPRDIATLTFDLEVTERVLDTGLRALSMYRV